MCSTLFVIANSMIIMKNYCWKTIMEIVRYLIVFNSCNEHVYIVD